MLSRWLSSKAVVLKENIKGSSSGLFRRLLPFFVCICSGGLMGLQDLGVIRFAICVQSLKQCHTEVRRGRRIIKTKQWKSRRHRRCIERRSLFANSISNLYTKRLPQNSYQESVRYTSVALCTVGTSVILHYLRPLRDSVCILYKTFNLSLHISEEPVLFFKQPLICVYCMLNYLYIIPLCFTQRNSEITPF